ncbi:MAG: hypothetical protein IJH05_07060 [Firmicutes bacterium]|nr:hypothetical protein [Bacillota bacterium]
MARFTEYEKKLRPYLQAMPDIFRYVIVLVLLFIGIANLYILHGIVLDGLSPADSGWQSFVQLR